MPRDFPLLDRYRPLACATLSLALGIFADGVAKAADAAPSVPDLAASKCIIGMEKFLPADYYYCLAAQSYGEQHYGQARKYFSEAASWASKPAEYVLGVMALEGDHQAIDRPLALAWFALAAERHTARFEQAYQELRTQLSADELKKSAEQLQQLSPTYADSTAAQRAESRYRESMRSMQHIAGGSAYCLDGQLNAAKTAGPGSFATLSTEAATCAPVEQVSAMIDKQAGQVFEDWGGHVVVGPLRNLDSPQKP